VWHSHTGDSPQSSISDQSFDGLFKRREEGITVPTCVCSKEQLLFGGRKARNLHPLPTVLLACKHSTRSLMMWLANPRFLMWRSVQPGTIKPRCCRCRTGALHPCGGWEAAGSLGWLAHCVGGSLSCRVDILSPDSLGISSGHAWQLVINIVASAFREKGDARRHFRSPILVWVSKEPHSLPSWSQAWAGWT
jgi:hypothetical protein